ncbi:MAG TPA: hypothetical protein VK489_02290 [Ferruginibacter sp.]|nr:hypothetical protein [Ferruginibacter sp.]
MKKTATLIIMVTGILISLQTNAKVWRINNNNGVTADFTSGAAAIASASVVNDDTLHFEGSATAYAGFNLSKRLVIIGTGYFLSGVNSNSGLQANPNSATFSGGTIAFDSTGSGSTLIGLDNISMGIGGSLGSATDNITLTRCNISTISQYYAATANTKMTGWKINKCHIDYMSFSGSNEILQNWEITNNIFISYLFMNNTNNLNNLVRNNVFRGPIDIYSAYFSNNIITGSTFTTINTTVKNNISTGTNLPAGNGNLNGQSDANLFQGLTGNSTDGRWRLKAASPAIGAGETILGITPDCGAYGTADPYVLSGIPPIPTIYLLTVPGSVASNATTMPVTISTRSNN